MEGNIQQEKKLNTWAIIVSIVTFLAIVGMRKFKIHLGIDLSFLPMFHAILNSLTAVFLLIGLYFIKNGQRKQHQKMMTGALIISVVFLMSYVLYHITNEETKFGGEGIMRTIYFILLITHILAAAIILPFILFTFIRAYTGSFERHKRMARWVYPIWLYVAISGPICYLMLKPYY